MKPIYIFLYSDNVDKAFIEHHRAQADFIILLHKAGWQEFLAKADVNLEDYQPIKSFAEADESLQQILKTYPLKDYCQIYYAYGFPLVGAMFSYLSRQEGVSDLKAQNPQHQVWRITSTGNGVRHTEGLGAELIRTQSAPNNNSWRRSLTPIFVPEDADRSGANSLPSSPLKRSHSTDSALGLQPYLDLTALSVPRAMEHQLHPPTAAEVSTPHHLIIPIPNQELSPAGPSGSVSQVGKQEKSPLRRPRAISFQTSVVKRPQRLSLKSHSVSPERQFRQELQDRCGSLAGIMTITALRQLIDKAVQQDLADKPGRQDDDRPRSGRGSR